MMTPIQRAAAQAWLGDVARHLDGPVTISVRGNPRDGRAGGSAEIVIDESGEARHGEDPSMIVRTPTMPEPDHSREADCDGSCGMLFPHKRKDCFAPNAD